MPSDKTAKRSTRVIPAILPICAGGVLAMCAGDEVRKWIIGHAGSLMVGNTLFWCVAMAGAGLRLSAEGDDPQGEKAKLRWAIKASAGAGLLLLTMAMAGAGLWYWGRHPGYTGAAGASGALVSAHIAMAVWQWRAILRTLRVRRAGRN